MNLILLGITIGAISGFLIGVYRAQVTEFIMLVIHLWPLVLIICVFIYSFIYHTSDAIDTSILIAVLLFLLYISSILSKHTIFNREETNCFVLGSAISIYFVWVLVSQFQESGFTNPAIWALLTVLSISTVQFFAYRRGIKRESKNA